ncbi:MAG: arylsulfatase A-like enzyme [Planctomycetota bacterium]|jgi:arylsulfatase A-like enzyme
MVVAGLAAVITLLTGCGEPEPKPNFLLLSIDTLRADHLGIYGYERDTSPNLDRFAKRSIRFERALAPAPWTLPSHIAMLSGRHPYRLGIDGIDSSIPEGVPMLAGILGAAGYQTAAFVDSSKAGYLGAERGFERGFDRYEHGPFTPEQEVKYDIAKTVDVGLDWLGARDPLRPFFLFLHTKSVHAAPVAEEWSGNNDRPYISPEPFGSQFLPESHEEQGWRNDDDHRGVRYLRDLNEKLADGEIEKGLFSEARIAELRALYDGGIRYVDAEFERLLTGLDELELSDNTVLVVTSDHGEAFIEHYFFLHKEVFSAESWVPLIVYDPRLTEPAVKSATVSLLDVVPTILARAGMRIDASIDGRDLLKGGLEADDERGIFSYSKIRKDPLYEAFALERGKYRLIYHKHRKWDEFRADLFDRSSDPNELVAIDSSPELKSAMLDELVELMRAKTSVDGTRIELDEDTLDGLRSLGYVD